jgi:hypothetical protein
MLDPLRGRLGDLQLLVRAGHPQIPRLGLSAIMKLSSEGRAAIT